MCVRACSVTQSCPIFATPWTVAHQAPLSMRFSRQEYWNGLPFPPPEDLPNPRIKPESLASQASSALAGRFSTTVPPGKPKCLLDIRCLTYDGFLFFPYPKYLNSLLKQNIKPYISPDSLSSSWRRAIWALLTIGALRAWLY